MTDNRTGAKRRTPKEEFREAFHRGELFRLWRGEDGKGTYLARWAKHRSDVVLEILDARNLGRTGWSLDVGLGSGFLLAELERRGGRAVGADFSRSILEGIRGRGCGSAAPSSRRLFQADVESLPFRDETFELVTCLGVLEYLDEDGTALTELHRVLRRGGSMILAVASYHRLGNLSSLVLRRIAKRTWRGDSSRSPLESSLENMVRMVNPLRLREESVRVGFDVRSFRCFGGRIFGRYLPIRLFVPGVVYIGDHCVMHLEKPVERTRPISRGERNTT